MIDEYYEPQTHPRVVEYVETLCPTCNRLHLVDPGDLVGYPIECATCEQLANEIERIASGEGWLGM